MTRGNRIIAVMAAFLVGCSGADNADNTESDPLSEEPDSSVQSSVEDDINLDIWLERMEVGSRELYSAREAVLAAVDLKEGDWVADIGAGTGLYSLLFADAVGPTGRVFAEDIEPLFLDLINQRSADADFGNVTAVLGREDDVTLPHESIDVIFIADTYHYFDKREEIMRSIYDTLKPGGYLILVEYDIKADEKPSPEKSHVRFGKAAVISEVKYIGFEFVDAPTVDGLGETYFVRFQKPPAG